VKTESPNKEKIKKSSTSKEVKGNKKDKEK